MIAFENPLYLQLCWLIPVILTGWVAIHKRQAKLRIKLGDAQAIKKLVTGHVPFILYLKFSLLLLSLTLLIMAMARPKLITAVFSAAPLNQTSLVFALDVSKSMLVADVPPNRLALAKNTLVKIIKGLHGEQAGIVIFAGNANTYIPLTTEYKMIIDAIQYVSNNSIAKQGTSLGEALKTSSFLLYPKNIRIKVIAILSDGENLSDTFEATADSARNAGIKLFAFGAGTRTGGNISMQRRGGFTDIEKGKSGKPVVSRLNTQNLERICGADTGRYLTLANPADDASLFLNRLHTMQSNIKQKTSVQKDLFQLFLFGGLLLLVIEMLLPYHLKKT